MSIISKELIENTLMTDMDQIAKINPVIQLSRSSSFDDTQSAMIRGFSLWNMTLFDGLRLSSPPQGITLEEVERIEVLSGAPGFLYGAGNVGGAIDYVFKRPTYKRLTNLTLGNYGGQQYFAHIDLGDKIDDEGKFAYRLNIMQSNGETAVENQRKKEKLYSGSIDWNVSDNFLVQLEGSHREYSMTAPTMSFNYRSVSHPSAFDANKSYTPTWNNFDNESDRVSLKATWDISESLKLRTAYLHKEHEFYLNNTQTTYGIANSDGTFKGYTIKYTPQERTTDAYYVYLDSEFETGSINHKMTIGISGDIYENEVYENSIAHNYSTATNVSLDELNFLEDPNLTIADKGKKYKSAKATNHNIIIGDDIVINEQYSLMLGANYSTLGSYSYNVDGEETGSYKDSALTPTLSFIYKPFKDLTTYITYIEALENGMVVGNTYTNAGEVLEPLISKQYEIGAKYNINDNLLISSALFRIEKANQYSDNATPTPKYVQDGEQVHQGIELTFTGKVTDNLTLFGGGTWMDLSIEKSNNTALEGKKPTDTASKMAKIYAEYKIPQVKGLTLTGGAYYVGEKYADTTNTDRLPSYNTFDLGVRYKTKIDKYPTTFIVNVQNLTDEDYWASSSTLGDPRSVAFSMKMEF